MVMLWKTGGKVVNNRSCLHIFLKDLQRIKTGACVTSSYILSHRELKHMETKVNLPGSTALHCTEGLELVILQPSTGIPLFPWFLFFALFDLTWFIILFYQEAQHFCLHLCFRLHFGFSLCLGLHVHISACLFIIEFEALELSITQFVATL